MIKLHDFLHERDLFTLLLTSSICLWFYWLWSRRNLYLFALKFPGSFGLPVFGSLGTIKHIKYLIRGIGILTERCKSQTICIWLGVFPTVVSSDPDFIEEILSSNKLLNKSTALYTPLYKALGGGLISSPEHEWRHSRKMINPSFYHKTLLTFLPIFNKGKDLVISLMEPLVDNNEHELDDILKKISLGVAVETTMGKSINLNEKIAEDFRKKFRVVLDLIIVRTTLSVLKLDSLFHLSLKYHRVKHYLRNYVLNLVHSRIENMKTETETACTNNNNDDDYSIKKPPSIFIDQAIQIYKEQKFTINDIMVESNNIVGASFESTANGVLSALLMLAIHPDIQERLFDEIVNIFPEKDFDMKYEHIQQLPYLDRVTKETLRLAPSVPIIGRQVVQDIQLANNLNLPKGLQIFISIFHVHRRKDIWGEDANKFNPDNFLPENISDKHAYSYIPFSKGRRDCIGWRYALYFIKIVTTGVIRNYRLTTSMKLEDMEYIENVTLKYLKGPVFQIHRREK